jgi:hypothetical protein
MLLIADRFDADQRITGRFIRTIWNSAFQAERAGLFSNRIKSHDIGFFLLLRSVIWRVFSARL